MTDADPRDALERQMRSLCDAEDRSSAATLILASYGREILGFLLSRLHDRDAASETFSRFAEDMWRGLDGFRWQCSARVWCYTLARHAASHTVREARRARSRHVPLSRAGPLSELEEKIRTETLAIVRTENKNRMARLRERLPLDDQTLLILRVNRKLTWKEIAQIMLHDAETADGTALEKEAVRLRKRYQSAKEKLQQMALEEGLVPKRRDG